MLFAFWLLSLFTSCQSEVLSTEQGLASYYADYFHNKNTANGEVYDTSFLTAAHLELPFGQRVRVVRVDNGKSTIVRINDRGPYNKNRIIDLSKAAAKELDMIKDGVVKVRIEVLRD